MSIKFAICRSEFDRLLAWPFSWNISLWVYDQLSKRPHIIDRFVPDPTSDSFSRPICERNPLSEIRRFYPISMLQKYGSADTSNDSLFIGIVLEMVEMPQRILPDLLCLDVALPESLREAQRERMIEEFKRVESSQGTSICRQENEMLEKALLTVRPPFPAEADEEV